MRTHPYTLNRYERIPTRIHTDTHIHAYALTHTFTFLTFRSFMLCSHTHTHTRTDTFKTTTTDNINNKTSLSSLLISNQLSEFCCRCFVYVLSSERFFLFLFSKASWSACLLVDCFVFFVSAVPGKGEDRDQDEALIEFLL